MTNARFRRVVRGLTPILALAGVAIAAACARPGSPPGGPEDRRPPQVLAVEPDTFAIVEPGEGRIRIRYNERISERPREGTLDDAVTISPRTGDVRVSHSRDGLEVELLGGFRPNTVYRVTVEPVVSDMFNNPMAVPFEWTFSTGPAFEENAIVGLAFDRVTGDPVPSAVVQAFPLDSTGEADTIPQIARVDDEGIFALRWLPAGGYRIVAFVDRDRDGSAGEGEISGRVGVAGLGGDGMADTATAFVPLLEPDTTSAVLARAEFVDSTALRIGFDDALDPDVPTSAFAARIALDRELIDSVIAQTGDTLLEARSRSAGASMPRVSEILLPDAWEARVDSLRRRADSIAAVEAAREAAAAGEEAPAPPPAEPTPAPEEDAEDPDLLPDGSVRPVREVVVVFISPVPAEVPLRFTIEGVVNVNGVPNGGGSVGLRREPPAPEPDPAAPAGDSLAADSVGVGAADSTATDTLTVDPVGADTLGADSVVIDTFRIRRSAGRNSTSVPWATHSGVGPPLRSILSG